MNNFSFSITFFSPSFYAMREHFSRGFCFIRKLRSCLTCRKRENARQKLKASQWVLSIVSFVRSTIASNHLNQRNVHYRITNSIDDRFFIKCLKWICTQFRRNGKILMWNIIRVLPAKQKHWRMNTLAARVIRNKYKLSTNVDDEDDEILGVKIVQL